MNCCLNTSFPSLTSTVSTCCTSSMRPSRGLLAASFFASRSESIVRSASCRKASRASVLYLALSFAPFSRQASHVLCGLSFLSCQLTSVGTSSSQSGQSSGFLRFRLYGRESITHFWHQSYFLSVSDGKNLSTG